MTDWWDTYINVIRPEDELSDDDDDEKGYVDKNGYWVPNYEEE